MADGVDILIACLATYRLATDVAWERGPGDAYERLRGWATQRWGADSWQAEGVACPICVSFWAAPALLVLYTLIPWLVLWLAVAGAAALLARLPHDD